MASIPFLPRFFRWAFTVLAALSALAAVVVLIAMAIDPRLPAGTHFGPVTSDFAGAPATFAVSAEGGPADITGSLFNGAIKVAIGQARDLFAVVVHHGLPVLLIDTIFLALLFDSCAGCS